jgi:hypothetical protein
LAAFDRYKNDNLTGLELELFSGKTFLARAYCDHEAAGVYTGKPPFVKLSLIPTVQFLGQPIAFDISQSGSATSTIDTFDIDWGGSTDIGDITAGDWALDPLSGDVVYDDLGTYTVTASVTDLLGEESETVEITVEIVEPVERVYIGTPNAGVYITDNGSTPAASNSGLSGDDLKLRSIRLNPHYADLPAGQQHVWIATAAGLAYSTDGAATWTLIDKDALGDPVNAAEDVTPPVTADLDQIDIAFCSQDSSRVYLLRVTVSPEGAWLYWSDDYGETWDNEGIGTL